MASLPRILKSSSGVGVLGLVNIEVHDVVNL